MTQETKTLKSAEEILKKYEVLTATDLGNFYRKENVIQAMLAYHEQFKEPTLTSIKQILDGIDRDDLDDGWWETSTGVAFGANKLKEIIKIFNP